MINLQSLFGSILDSSKKLSKLQFFTHILTFTIAVSTIFLNGKYLFAACISVAISELMALLFKYLANEKKGLGQEILRANMLKVAFGKQSDFSISYLSTRVPSSVWKDSSQYENAEYYSEVDSDEGKLHLAKILQESCFWSHHLYSKCASSRFKWIAGFFGTLFFVGISYSAYVANDQVFSAQRIFVLMVSLVPLWNEIEKVIAWKSASSKLKEIDHRIEIMSGRDDSELLALYGDYNVVTAQAALIPQGIYESEKPLLDKLWLQRKST